MAVVKTNLKTVWNGNAKGKGNIQASYLDTDIAIPESLGGNGEGAEPKEILITSATACFTMTLTGMLQAQKLSVDQIHVDTESTQTTNGNLAIVHSCHVVLATGSSDEQAQAAFKAIETADKRCAIGNMLRKADVDIKAEGNVSVS